MRPARLAFQTVMLVGQGPQQMPAILGEVAETILLSKDTASALQLMIEKNPRLIFLGTDIDPNESMAFLAKARICSASALVVVLADKPSTDWAVRFVRGGAYDYIGGPLDDDRIRQLLAGISADRDQTPSRERFFSDSCPPGVPIVGRSSGISKVLDTIRLVSESRCNPVLILGETGTGKELGARAVHAWRFGNSGKFVAVNCAALTANLLESELFGHVKGAFTGADRDKMGLLEVADSGSIFLDEISEMPLELQAKLLRFLQEKTFRKVGGTSDITCNATIIASSNWALFDQAIAGKFRKDLYYRLAVFPIKIPPLRNDDRRSDIPLLAEYFIETANHIDSAPAKSLSKAAQTELLHHHWPGNVRELRNVIERGMIIERSSSITPASLIIDRPSDQEKPAAGTAANPFDFSLEAAEREFIFRALQESRWQRTRAAALLGITRATLHAKIKRYDIKIPDAAGDETLPRPQSPSSRERNPDANCLNS